LNEANQGKEAGLDPVFDLVLPTPPMAKMSVLMKTLRYKMVEQRTFSSP
jgi:hypothetical protein